MLKAEGFLHFVCVGFKFGWRGAWSLAVNIHTGLSSALRLPSRFTTSSRLSNGIQTCITTHHARKSTSTPASINEVDTTRQALPCFKAKRILQVPVFYVPRTYRLINETNLLNPLCLDTVVVLVSSVDDTQ